MNLYVIRHGQTDWNLKNILQGSTDIELNSAGIKQAKITAEALKNVNFSAIFSSPLSRAINTANYINKYHNLNISTDIRLIERNFGDFEGTDLLKNMLDYWDYNLNLDGNNVENIHIFFNRVYNFLLEIYNTYKDTDANILISTHSGVTIAINAIINNISENLLSLGIKNCEFKVFKNIKLDKKEN